MRSACGAAEATRRPLLHRLVEERDSMGMHPLTEKIQRLTAQAPDMRQRCKSPGKRRQSEG